KVGTVVATPAVPVFATDVQQWMCAADTVPLRPENVVSTRMVKATVSMVTSAVPVPVAPTASGASVPEYWIDAAETGNAAARTSVRPAQNPICFRMDRLPPKLRGASP